MRRPSARDIARILDNCQDLPLSYGPVGLSLQSPAGYDVDEEIVTIGHGEADFRRACSAIAAWQHFGFHWVEVFPKAASLTVRTNVVVVISHLGFWSANGARIVSRVTGSADRPAFGFSYGTLTNHAERGEELFEISLDPKTGDVKYRIRAVSQPRAALARLGYPIARRLQARFRRESAAVMKRAVATSEVTYASGKNGG